MPEGWLCGVLALALAGMLVGAAALYGVAVLSARGSMPAASSIADFGPRSEHDIASGALGFSNDSLPGLQAP